MARRLTAAASALVIGCCIAAAAPPASAQTTATVRDDGTILVDGKPFFPVGIYHTSWIDERYNAVQIQDLEDIAAAGFNTMHPTLRATHSAFLERATELGIRTIVAMDWDNAADIVGSLATSPSVIGWNVADDFNTPIEAPEFPPTVVQQRAALVSAIAPDHLTYGSGTGNAGALLAPYLGTMAATGIQAYPIEGGTVGQRLELRQNVDYYANAWEQIGRFGQPVIANLQAFAWSPIDSGGRYPTPRESRNLLYGALVNGVKGILHYAYYFEAGSTMPEQAPDLWDELKLQNLELDYLRDHLIDGARIKLQTGNAWIHGAVWEHADHTLVALVNTHRQNTISVSLAIPGENLGSEGRHPFAHRADAGFTFDGTTLSGALGPEDVCVYVISDPHVEHGICGDPTGDGQVTATDALVVLSASAGAPGTCALCTCDVNDSGEITATDALLTLLSSLDLRTPTCPACGP